MDALVLRLHQVDKRCHLVRHALQEAVPEQLVLDRVVVGDEVRPQLDMICDLVRPPAVSCPYPEHGGDGELELTAEAGVRDDHHAHVGEPWSGKDACGGAGGAHSPPPRLCANAWWATWP